MDHMETYFGLIKTPQDALVIFEGKLSDIERQSVRSGSVYCFDEREAGMRRWTDGKSWSPSRVTGSFLTYRELEEAVPSLAGKNIYRPDGLLKQSFSITTSENQKLHLISYFTNDDVNSGRLIVTPTQDPRFAKLVIPSGIYPETAPSDQPTPSSGSPSPPLAHRARQRPQTRTLQASEEDRSKLTAHRRTGSSSSTHSNGHRRTNSGSLSLKEHRYSPIQVSDAKHVASRSRSSSNVVGPSPGLHGMRPPYVQHRYKSTSPSRVPSSYPTRLPHEHSPTGSWVSDDDHSMEPRSEPIALAPINIPALRQLPPAHFDGVNKQDDHLGLNEQDSLSVLASLATHSMMLPKLEPQEVSREQQRWVEDDRQLRALSSMFRL
ncbi:hypothetical protein BGZ52_009536 [Haplosporangium bisporale]|nr:hypothetical protein BGZ52_009536 [Haplosporangium bisporale]KAF9212610.1 hypothetical protein BGZ59_006552 [Podila verticillata]